MYLAYSSHNADKQLLITCQHRNHDSMHPQLSHCRRHGQLSRPYVPYLCCTFGSEHHNNWHCGDFKIVAVSSFYGRTDVRWRPGQETSLVPLCSKLKSFGSKYTVLNKVLLVLLGIWLRLQPRTSDSLRLRLYNPCNGFEKLKLHWTKLFNKVICSPKSEPKVAEKFRTILLNPVQVWLSRKYKIQIH